MITTILLTAFTFLAGCEVPAETRIENTCSDYCTHLETCDDEIDVTQCEIDCAEAAGDCMVDELDDSLAALDLCAEESCDDIARCSLGVALECYLGI